MTHVFTSSSILLKSRLNAGLSAALLMVFCLSASIGWAQISFTGSYTQDFNSLASTGTSSTVPAGWAFLEIGLSANAMYTANNGGSGIADTYSYGATGSSERAFGELSSGNLPTVYIGAQFTNNTGSTITSLTISYTGEQWRRSGSNNVDSL
ncbi:MAG: hypothetical protein NZM43_10340, partial [Saprospiraceae bacterium]|nr:hypothetical protein [Saprospiraceae bacterium]MDW8484708.1 hypothetical protein [Saprospiraceae bacterium]